MFVRHEVSRRVFLHAAAGGVLAAATIEEKEKLPVIAKRLEKVFLAPGKMPNGLQAVADGLWILDQEDPNKVHKVRYEDGSVLKEIQTESLHGSGITYGAGALWIASTYGLKTLKVDPETGKTLASFDTPGVGKPKWGNPRRASGAHGLEWVDGKYWIAVPPSVTIYLIEPNTGKVVRSIPAPGVRPHGLAWDRGKLWCVESNDRAIYKMDPKDGKLLAKIQLRKEDPEPHGMSMWKGVFWYCDATSRWVCRLV
jgi:outer membrane protein assembly factor BamB